VNEGRLREWVRCSSLIDWPVYPRLRATMQASTGARNSGRRGVPSKMPMRQGGQVLCRTNAGLSQNGCRCTLGGMGTGLNFPVQARLAIILPAVIAKGIFALNACRSARALLMVVLVWRVGHRVLS
jgi:hypothetical protein